MAPEQILAWPIALGIYVVVNGVPGLLCPLVPSYRPQKQLRAFLSVSPQTLASSLVRQTWSMAQRARLLLEFPGPPEFAPEGS